MNRQGQERRERERERERESWAFRTVYGICRKYDCISKSAQSFTRKSSMQTINIPFSRCREKISKVTANLMPCCSSLVPSTCIFSDPKIKSSHCAPRSVSWSLTSRNCAFVASCRAAAKPRTASTEPDVWSLFGQACWSKVDFQVSWVE
jgi:hypothetical protein